MDFEQFNDQEQWHHQPTSEQQNNTSNLSVWQRWLFRRPLETSELAQLPAYAVSLHQGWQHYTCGDYLNAFTLFSACIADKDMRWPSMKLDAALGICRLYTRTGHWQHARHWGVHALGLARSSNRLFDISRCFNALGDLFCRADQTKLAHVCLTTSANVLPQGTIHKARHLNSLATTLMRQGELLRAESVLMNSLYLAKDTSDSDSIWHALARIQWLYAEKAPAAFVLERFSALLPTQEAPIARSYIDVGMAAIALKAGEINAAKQLFIDAAKRTSTTTPIESSWFKRCAGLTICESQADILHLPKILPDTDPSHSTFDRCWFEPPLANDQLIWLLDSEASLSYSQLHEQRRHFFI